MHAETNTQEWHPVFPGVLHCLNLAVDTPVSKTSRHQNGIEVFEQRRPARLNILCIDVFNLYLGQGLQAGMVQGFVEGFIGVRQIHVLAHHPYGDRTLGLAELPFNHVVPFTQIGSRAVEPKLLQYVIVEAIVVEVARNLINRVGVQKRNNRSELNVSEQRNLAPRPLVDIDRAATQQHFRLQADRAQLLDRMLGGLCFDFTCRGDVRNQGEVHQQCPGSAQLQFQLPNGLEERLALNITCGPANFYNSHISAVRPLDHPSLDLIRDMGNDLYRPAKVIPAPLFAQHRVVDPAGGEIVALGHCRPGEALVVAQIQVCFGAILGNKHLTVLKRTHGAGVNVDVGI